MAPLDPLDAPPLVQPPSLSLPLLLPLTAPLNPPSAPPAEEEEVVRRSEGRRERSLTGPQGGGSLSDLKVARRGTRSHNPQTR